MKCDSKEIHDKLDKLSDDIKNITITLECHLTEFRLFKKIGYWILIGMGGIIIKLFWKSVNDEIATFSQITGSVSIANESTGKPILAGIILLIIVSIIVVYIVKNNKKSIS